MRNATPRTGRAPPAAVMCLLLAGCAAVGPPAGEPAPEPVEAAVDPAPAAPADPPPQPAVRPAPVPVAPRAEIALIVDASTQAHGPVADAIDAALPPRRFRVTRLTSEDTAELEALRGQRVTLIAIGANALRAARSALPNQPVVFCQIPRHGEALAAGGPIWGVESLPPLSLQLKGWLSVDPTLRTIALIVSAAGAALAEDARRAASSLAADLLVETSASDRETLYLFRRLATTVDGLWLLPDNDALSPQVLREILSYASTRGVGVLTFNEALLARGALLTATPVPADIASHVARIVEQVASGRTANLPPITPLTAAEFTLNVGVAAALGLPPSAVQRWVVREPD